MVRWIGGWFTASMLIVLGLGLVFVFWAIWPLLPSRLPSSVAPTMSAEGIVAILVLIVILVGFGKLLCSK